MHKFDSMRTVARNVYCISQQFAACFSSFSAVVRIRGRSTGRFLRPPGDDGGLRGGLPATSDHCQHRDNDDDDEEEEEEDDDDDV